MDFLHFWIPIIIVLCAICCYVAPIIYWKCTDSFNGPGPQYPNEIEMQDFDREDTTEDVSYEREMEEYNRQLNGQVNDENTNQS